MSYVIALCPAGSPKMNQGKLVKCREEEPCPSGYLCLAPKFGMPSSLICCPRPGKVLNASNF